MGRDGSGGGRERGRGREGGEAELLTAATAPLILSFPPSSSLYYPCRPLYLIFHKRSTEIYRKNGLLGDGLPTEVRNTVG